LRQHIVIIGLCPAFRGAERDDSHLAGKPEPAPQSSPMVSYKAIYPTAKKQPPRKWKWGKNADNERIQEMCLVEKIIHTNPTQG
jgi:hypothetical protein